MIRSHDQKAIFLKKSSNKRVQLNLVWNLNGLIVKFTVQKPEIWIKNLGVMLIEDVKKKCGNVLVSALVCVP
jgi:hypothetical protein